MNTTLFETAHQKLDSNEDISEYLLNFLPEDIVLLERVINAVEALLCRDDLSPVQINSISKVLLGLRRIPLMTPGLDIELGLLNEGEGGSYEYTLVIKEDHFELSSGGFQLFQWGSDSISGPTFEVENHYRTDMNIFDLNWTDIVLEGVKNFRIRIDDTSDDSQLDWANDDGSIFWDWLGENVGWDDHQFRDWMNRNLPSF